MLKVMARIMIILLVFGVVAGGIYAYVNSSAGQAAFAGQGDFRANIGTAGFGGNFHRDFGDRGLGEAGGTRGLAGIANNLGEVALITALVVVAQKMFKKTRSRVVDA